MRHEAKADLVTVSMLLGHESAATTAIYTQPGEADLTKAPRIARQNPLSLMLDRDILAIKENPLVRRGALHYVPDQVATPNRHV